MVLTIVNNSGFDDTKIYLLCTGSNQTGPDADEHFGYLDFANNSFHEIGPKSAFSLNVSTMTKTLNEFKNNNTYSINVPKMVSGRLYFAFGDNFDLCPSFSASGPSNGTTNTVVYDKVEFDTWSNPNINTTNVDFFGISYYVTATESSTKDQVERGYLKSRDAVFAAFENLAGNDYQLYGNTGIFEALSITRTIKDGVDTVRRIGPQKRGFRRTQQFTEFRPTEIFPSFQPVCEQPVLETQPEILLLQQILQTFRSPFRQDDLLRSGKRRRQDAPPFYR